MSNVKFRLLLDTNIIIPLLDSDIVLTRSIKNFIRLINLGGHQLLLHPATENDIKRDNDQQRRQRTLQRLGQYQLLDNVPICPWNTDVNSENNACDNEILYALYCNAAHALITEDQGIHRKAKRYGLESKVYNIQTAEDWLHRLHEPTLVKLPNIQDVEIFTLTPELSNDLFNSLEVDYPKFSEWFSQKAKEGRRAWISRDENNILGAICIYTVQSNVIINDNNEILYGNSLKLCTFKVGERRRGKKIGELFLKAAFQYATENECLNIFIHGNAKKQPDLEKLLEDFGFCIQGTYNGDSVWVKRHPKEPPNENISARDYIRLYFPHYKELDVNKYIVPIKPEFHEMLFPDYSISNKIQLNLFNYEVSHVGNAIKLAYLCHAQTRKIEAGDILLFYRTQDEKAFTTIGIVDDFKILNDPTEIAVLVSRRTVYSNLDIDKMTNKEVKVILFKMIKHVKKPIKFTEMLERDIVSGPIQSITALNDFKYRSLIDASGI